jgi:hypothetical protein
LVPTASASHHDDFLPRDRVGQIFNQSLVQEVEELFDLSEWSLATLADIDEPIAVALQRSPF